MLIVDSLAHEGNCRSAFFDAFPEAERALRDRKTEVDEVRRGRRRPEGPTRTFSELAECWLATRAREKRSKVDDESMLRKHLVPTFGQLPLGSITVEHIERYKVERQAIAPQSRRSLR